MLTLERIRKCYFIADERITVLNSLTVTFPSHGFIGIKGESGCGKSTLLNIISTLEKPDYGFIKYHHQLVDDEFLRNEVAIINQNDDLIQGLNVKENILLACKVAHIAIDQKEFISLIKRLELEKHLKKYPYQLSGGQKKRVSIARALLKKASIILCDEPTGSLHELQANEVMKILKEIASERLVILVSHDQYLLNKYCDYVYLLEKGVLHGDYKGDNKIIKKDVKKKKYSLLFYVIKQLKAQKNIFFFLLIFEMIILLSSFLIVTSINGIEDKIKAYYQHSVLKNVIKIENYNSEPFDTVLFDSQYDYLLSLGDCSLIGNYEFLPSKKDHILLDEGVLPINNKEVIVSYDLKDYFNQIMTYQYANENISLKVVGVLKDDFFIKETVFFHEDFRDYIPEYKNENCLVVEDENNEERYRELQKDYIVYNEVIDQHESYMSLFSIAKFIALFFFVISFICSFFLFYIAYQTIGIKRRKDSAILMMLGLKNKNLFYLFMLEAFFVGIVMLVGGFLLSFLFYYYFNYVFVLESYFSFSLKMEKNYFVIISVLYLMLSLTSSYLPTKKIIDSHLISILREE